MPTANHYCRLCLSTVRVRGSRCSVCRIALRHHYGLTRELPPRSELVDDEHRHAVVEHYRQRAEAELPAVRLKGVPMLVLSRYVRETVVIETPAGPIVITVCDSDRGKVRLGFECPKEWQIRRGELLKKEDSDGGTA